MTSRGGARIVLRSLSGQRSQVFMGHTAEVRKLSFRADGQLLASASADQTIKLWTPDGKTVATLKGHRGAVWDVEFSPDGNWLVSASEDGTARLWQVEVALQPEQLIPRGCQWLQNYLQHGADVAGADRDLC